MVTYKCIAGGPINVSPFVCLGVEPSSASLCSVRIVPAHTAESSLRKKRFSLFNMSSLTSKAAREFSPPLPSASAFDHGGIHYPRHSEDATTVLNILGQWLPPEIGLQILDHAEYWILSRVCRQEEVIYDEDDCFDAEPYLTSAPIQGDRFPVRKIRLNIWSHDQGWSSFPDEHGTFKNSWTWFELAIERPPGRDEIFTDKEARVATNLHGIDETMRHQIIIRNDHESRWMQVLQAGDRVSLVPRALYPGWENFVEAATIEIYTWPVLA